MIQKLITSRRNGFLEGAVLIALVLISGFQEPLAAQADFTTFDTTYSFDDYFGDFEEDAFSDEFFGGEESYDDFLQGESFGGEK